MIRTMPRALFALHFAPETVVHLRAIERRYYGLIRRSLLDQLSYSPAVPTRNRKPLDPPGPGAATWELRFGPANRFRAFHEVDAASRVVRVLAIGVKTRSILAIGAEELEP